MKTKLLAIGFLAASSMFAQTRFSFSIGIGGPSRGYYSAAPAPYIASRPPCPGPDYFWTDGYWAQDRDRQAWVDGFWARRTTDYGYQAQPNAYEYREQYRERYYRHDRRDDDDRDFGRRYDRR